MWDGADPVKRWDGAVPVMGWTELLREYLGRSNNGKGLNTNYSIWFETLEILFDPIEDIVLKSTISPPVIVSSYYIVFVFTSLPAVCVSHIE